MSLIRRLPVFMALIVADAILFLFYSRVLLEVLATGEEIAGTGPATSSMNLLPAAMQLVMGIILVGAFGYLLGGISSERTAVRRRMR